MQPVLGDIALYVAVAMAIFAVLFGTRHIDATEHQDGLMLAIAPNRSSSSSPSSASAYSSRSGCSTGRLRSSPKPCNGPTLPPCSRASRFSARPR